MVTEFQISVFVAYDLAVTALGLWRSPMALIVAGMSWLLLGVLLWTQWGGLEGLVATGFLALWSVLLFAMAYEDATSDDAEVET